MPNVRLRIGAAVDNTMGDAVFRPLVLASKRAKEQINANLRGIQMAGGGGGGGGMIGAPSSAGHLAAMHRQILAAHIARDRQMRGIDAANARDRAKAQIKANQDVERAKDRESREAQTRYRQQMRERETLERAAVAKTAAEQRKADRAQETAQRRNAHIADAAALRVSGGSVRNMGGLARRGLGIAGDLASGAGVNFSLGSALEKRMALEASATDLSASGFMPGDARNGRKVDPRTLMAEAQATAIKTGVTSEDAMGGLQAFVGKTGDLATGRAVLADMATLSQATGANMKDVVDAAGDVSSVLGDIPNKAEAISETMRLVASGGKMGAVEMSNFATQMAKVAASAGQFGGDVGKNITQLASLVQEARAKGGASSATQAATSLTGFVATFSKAARRKQFKAAGVDIEDSKGALLDPNQIILNALKATGGSKEGMGKLFADAGARRITKGFENVYNQAGGGAKGLDAVKAEMANLQKDVLSKEQVARDAQTKLQTGKSQATILQETLSKELGDAAEKVAPKLMELAPMIGKVVSGMGSLVAWAASNPFRAAFIGMGASIMKSIGDEMLRATTEKMFGRTAGNMAVRGAGGTVPGLGPTPHGYGGGGAGDGGRLGALQGETRMGTALNVAGAALTIATIAAATFSIGSAVIESIAQAQGDHDTKTVLAEVGMDVAMGRAEKAKRAYDASEASGVVSPEAAAELDAARKGVEAERAKLATKVKGGEDYANRPGFNLTGGSKADEHVLGFIKSITGLGNREGLGGVRADAHAAEQLGALRAQLSKMDQLIAAVGKANGVGPPKPPGPPHRTGPGT